MNPPDDTLEVPLAAAPTTTESKLPEIGTPAEATELTADVVVITRDSHTELARSLGSIREAAAQAGAGLLFIDLGSTDETRTFAARHAPGAQGIWLGPQDGLPDALSAAAATSTADVLVVLNPALKPTSADGIVALVQHLQQHPYAAA